jgi:hypothetical protein
MHHNFRISASPWVFGLCVVALSACGGALGNQAYTPSGGAAFAQLSPDKLPVIESSCGVRLRLIVGKIVHCKLKEKGYGGKFDLANHAKGIVVIAHNERDTAFTVTGVLLGRGYLLARDRRKNELRISVHVTL